MSARARHRHRRTRSTFGKKVMLGLMVVFGLVVAGVGAAGAWVYSVANSAPSISTLKPLDSGESSEVFAADGSRLGYIQADILREQVSLDQIPKRLRNATIAIEDERFYSHTGVDYEAIVRAALENIDAGFEAKEGASTITQQLVRNLYIEKPEDTIERKIIEATMAREYEEQYSKEEILEAYLNTASYGTNNGRTAVGVESASQVYFDKSVSDLNLGEAALLAGLPQAPSQYNPFENPERAMQRRNLVLKAMLDQGMITQRKYRRWSERGLGLDRGYRYETIRYQYFFDYVQQELIERYGVNTVRLGGLKVHTTLEPRLQDAAQNAIDTYHTTPGAAAALVSVDADTGEIKAMASSSDYDDSQFNLAAQGLRQPGSAFKPFALTAAVDMGADPDSTYYAAPSTISLDVGGPEPWTVSGGGSSGATSLRAATASSINTVYAQLVLDIGPEKMDEMARKLGITAELNNYPAEVLGALTYGVSVLDMASAYSTIANGGVNHDARAIKRVEFPDGEVDEPTDNGTRVISDGVAYEVADVMKGALEYGTAAGRGIGCPAAGKTGTTELQSDAWFVGYTPHVSTAVWVGNPDARVPMPGYGADLAAPIWQAYMLEAATEPCDDFPEPRNPADLAPFSGEHTVSSDYGKEEPEDEEGEEDEEDANGDGEPDDAYAPGLQDGPGNGGNGNNGGPNNGNGGGNGAGTGGAGA